MQNLLKLLMDHYDEMLQQVSQNPAGSIDVHLRLPGKTVGQGRLLFNLHNCEYGDELVYEYEYIGHYFDEELKADTHVWFELLRIVKS